MKLDGCLLGESRDGEAIAKAKVLNPPLSALIQSASRRFETELEIMMSSLRFKPPVTDIIYVIGNEPGLRQTVIASRLRMDASTLGRHIDRLVSIGVVERTRVAEDRRAWSLNLTPSGQEVYASIHELVVTLDRDLVAKLGPQNYSRLHDLMRRWLDNK